MATLKTYGVFIIIIWQCRGPVTDLNHLRKHRIDYDITPSTILVSTDRGSGKDFFLYFNATNDGGGYETDKAKPFAACHNRTYSRSSVFPRTYARGSDPRCLGAPECSFDTMSNTEKCSSDDMWSLGCIVLEISAFITYGNPGLHEFQKQREMEIASLHRSLGNLDDKCFHDSHGPLESVRKFGQGIHRNGRRCDDITPRIVDLALNRLLVPQKSRCTAFELFNKVDEAIEISKDVWISMYSSVKSHIKMSRQILIQHRSICSVG